MCAEDFLLAIAVANERPARGRGKLWRQRVAAPPGAAMGGRSGYARESCGHAHAPPMGGAPG